MTRGHPFDRQGFFEVFDQMDGVNYCAVEQPVSQLFFRPDLAAAYSAFVLYDMPGMDFMAADPADGLAPRYVEPPAAFKRDFLELLERGHGFVFLHHALAAWPAWDEYAEIVGGRFLYKPGRVRGRDYPDSGYRHEVRHELAVTRQHPVTDGLPARFALTDEVYLAHAFVDSVIPLLRSDHDFQSDNFYSAQQAVQGTLYSREGWQHPPGSNLVGWVKHYRNSPIVYIQCGDGRAAYEDPNFRRLLGNAVRWVAGDEARQWARRANGAEA